CARGIQWVQLPDYW
nr:immunoglobulin heavy chain junction region [Macaca mulatta]